MSYDAEDEQRMDLHYLEMFVLLHISQGTVTIQGNELEIDPIPRYPPHLLDRFRGVNFRPGIVGAAVTDEETANSHPRFPLSFERSEDKTEKTDK